jgi:DNA-binding transcriptional MocR family regulator
VPSAELLPAKKLGRFLSAAIRNEKAALSVQLMPQGSLELRRAIARRLLETGCSAGPDEVIVTSGCLESIGLCLRALTQPGDIVAVESPTYFGVLQALERLHLQALEIPAGPCDGIDLEFLEEALMRHPVKALVVTPNGHNPLGSVMSERSREELVALASQHSIHIIEDDVYGDLCFSESRPRSLMAFDEGGLVMQCSSFCKTLAPGYRVGWLLPGSLSTQVMRMKFASSLGAASPCQMAIAGYLEKGGFDHHLRGLRGTLQVNLDRITRLIGESFPAETRVTRPDGGFVLWVELPLGTDSLELYQRAMQKGIGLTPGPIFSASGGYRNCIRLNAAVHWTEQTVAGLETIGRLATALNEQSPKRG